MSTVQIILIRIYFEFDFHLLVQIALFSEISMYGFPWRNQRPIYPMVRPFFLPFRPGPLRPTLEIDYFAFGDFRDARASDTCSEITFPKAVIEPESESTPEVMHAFGDVQQAQVSDTSSEITFPEAVIESECESTSSAHIQNLGKENTTNKLRVKIDISHENIKDICDSDNSKTYKPKHRKQSSTSSNYKLRKNRKK